MVVALTAITLLSAACGKSTSSTTSTPSASATPKLGGAANVFAAVSLTSALNKAKAAFVAANPGVTLTMNYGASGTLETQIAQGAPADLFASADQATMTKAVNAGLVPTSTVHTFAGNALQIIVPKGNPKGIQTLADLKKPGLAVVLGDPAVVPAGKYAEQALKTAGVTFTVKSLEANVSAVAQKVALGEADAGIVYVTDVKAAAAGGENVQGIDIPTPPNVLASYPIGMVKTAANPAVAQAFEAYLLSAPGQAILAGYGFLPPS